MPSSGKPNRMSLTPLAGKFVARVRFSHIEWRVSLIEMHPPSPSPTNGNATVAQRLRASFFHYAKAVLPDMTIAACAVLVSAEAGHLTVVPTLCESDPKL